MAKIRNPLRAPQLVASPATPPAGYSSLYFKDDGALYSKNPAGTEAPVGTPGPAGENNFVVEENGVYPARPTSEPVVFIGPDNPDTLGLMLVGDTWIDNDYAESTPIYALEAHGHARGDVPGDLTNLVAGSDFEDAEKVPWDLAASTRFTLSTLQARSGVQSLRMTPGAVFERIPALTSAEAREGDRYWIRFWARADTTYDSNSSTRLELLWDNGGLIGQVTFGVANFTTLGVWQEFTADITIPAIQAGATRIVPQIGASGTWTAGDVYVEDIEIRRMPDLATETAGDLDGSRLVVESVGDETRAGTDLTNYVWDWTQQGVRDSTTLAVGATWNFDLGVARAESPWRIMWDTPATGFPTTILSGRFPVKPGERFEFTFEAHRMAGTDWDGWLTFSGSDADGNYVNMSAQDCAVRWDSSSVPTDSLWTTVTGIVTIPADVTSVRVSLQKDGTGAKSDAVTGRWYFRQPRVRRYHEGYLRKIERGVSDAAKARSLALFRQAGSTQLGRLVIVTDLTWADSASIRMVMFNLSGYVYEGVRQSAVNLDVSFYNYANGPSFVNYSCSNLGTFPIPLVQWGYRNSDNRVVVIVTPGSASSEHWDYPILNIDGVMYGDISDWSMLITDDLVPYTIAVSQAPAQPTIDAEDTGWVVPTLLNGWVNYGGTWNTAAYRKVGRQVHLKGMIKNGTLGTAAFTLDSAYRPVSNYLLGTVSSTSSSVYAPGRVDVNTAGEVKPTNPSGNVWVTLDGLSFLTD